MNLWLQALSYLFGLAGFGLAVAGIAMVSVPAAFIVGGVALVFYAWLLDRARAALLRKGAE